MGQSRDEMIEAENVKESKVEKATITNNAMPTEKDLEKARSIFHDIVRDFPFVSETDRTHAFGLWILTYVRDMILGPTPLHLIEASMPGTGTGSLLNNLLQNSDSDYEYVSGRKQIDTAIANNQQVVRLMSCELISDTLATAITQRYRNIRLLGQKEYSNLPVRCIWVCRTINPFVSPEISRRCIRIRLDADRVGEPQIERACRAYDCIGNKESINWAASTFIAAWIATGYESFSGPVMGCFEDWGRVIGGIAECAGFEGFLDESRKYYEIEKIEKSWRSFIREWWKEYGTKKVTAGELFSLAHDNSIQFRYRNEHAKRTAFGIDMAQRAGYINAGYRIVKVGTRSRSALYQLEEVFSLKDDTDGTK
ncbi:MAG: hypothetical protein ACYC27_14765 [Armatimonadota bacterium]